MTKCIKKCMCNKVYNNNYVHVTKCTTTCTNYNVYTCQSVWQHVHTTKWTKCTHAKCTVLQPAETSSCGFNPDSSTPQLVDAPPKESHENKSRLTTRS